MTDDERADDFVRFLRLQFSPGYQLEVLYGMDEKIRARVLKKLGMSTSMDVFEKLPERSR